MKELGVFRLLWNNRDNSPSQQLAPPAQYARTKVNFPEGDATFSAYVGPREIHDATLLRSVQEDSDVTVYLQSLDGQSFALEFLDVASIHAVSPEGMMLYALAEVKTRLPLRRLVFVNWDEEDEAALEIVAADPSVIEPEE